MAKILIAAGEASGDFHGAALARALLRAAPGSEIRGIGGSHMALSGVKLLADIKDMNVMGAVELLPKLRKIWGIKRRLEEEARAWQPDAVIFIDFPDFNLRVAKNLRKAGLRTVYYIPPKLWAWRTGRVRKIKRDIDQLIVIFPFEIEFYAGHGVKAEFYGNPLIDALPAPSRPHPVDQPVVVLAPGSRSSEIRTLLGPMLDAVTELRRGYPDAVFRLPVASSVVNDALQAAVALGIELVHRPLSEVMAGADFAWVASGTASLETALVETPMAVVYKLNAISFAIAKRLVRIKHISLPNILSGRTIVTELLQGDVNGKRLAEEAKRILGDAGLRTEAHTELGKLRRSLGEPGGADRAAQAILNGLKDKLKEPRV